VLLVFKCWYYLIVTIVGLIFDCYYYSIIFPLISKIRQSTCDCLVVVVVASILFFMITGWFQDKNISMVVIGCRPCSLFGIVLLLSLSAMDGQLFYYDTLSWWSSVSWGWFTASSASFFWKLTKPKIITSSSSSSLDHDHHLEDDNSNNIFLRHWLLLIQNCHHHHPPPHMDL
jgi:hypothetical protein